MTSLTLYLASYFGGRGITVNTIAPGGLDDDFNADLFEEMPEAGFISGATINVDGGYHLQAPALPRKAAGSSIVIGQQ